MAKKIKLTMVAVPAIKGKMVERFLPLVKTIEKITGFRVDFRESPSYNDTIKKLTKGKAQIAWLGQSAFLEASKKVKLDPLAVAAGDENAETVYKTVFVVRHDVDISHLNEIKGKHLVLTEKGSTSGDLMPRHILSQYGMNPESSSHFSKVTYAGSQEDAVHMILQEKGDVAALSDINLTEMVESGQLDRKAVKIIHESHPIPGAPFVCLRNLPDEVKETLKQAFLEAHKHGDVNGYGHNIQHFDSPSEARTNFLKSYLRRQISLKTISVSLGFIAVFIAVAVHLKINPQRIFSSFNYFADIIGRMMPPDFSDFWNLIWSMVETIEIGFLGTVFAILLSVPIALMSAKNITNSKLLYYPAHLITTFFRAVPEFIIAMILVISVGFGALPGVLALGLHTMGFLSKFYAEEMEHVNTGPIEAIQSTGANWFQKITYAIFPQILPSFMGNNLYILDRNIRMATMLGIVGAGGIGYRLQSAFRMFKYREVSAIIIIIFVTIFIIDMISSKIRHMVK